MPHQREKRYVVEVEDPGGSCSLSTPSELSNTFTFKIRHSTERTGSWYNSFMQLHLHMLIFLQNRIIQQSSKWHSPTGLGLHIKWLGNMKPGLQKLSLTRVLRLHSTLQDQDTYGLPWCWFTAQHSILTNGNSSAKNHPIALWNRTHQTKLCWKTPKAATIGWLAPERTSSVKRITISRVSIHLCCLRSPDPP